MRKSKFTEEQIINILNSVEASQKVTDACRSNGISEQTYHRWKAKYGGSMLTKLAASNVRSRLKALASSRPRFGYRRLGVMLEREGLLVNHKRVYRLYREEGLILRRKRRQRASSARRVPMSSPTQAGERYSMDFMSDSLATGRVFRALNIVDDYTRECLTIEVDTSISGERVVRVLDRLVESGRKPKEMVVDNGPELTSKAVDAWAVRQKVHLHFIDPGRLMQNAYIESFNGRMRDECLNQH